MPIRLALLAALLGPFAFMHDAAAQDAAKVSLHESVTSAPASYTVLKRVWAGSWRSAFGVPSYATREEAASAFRDIAASLGGNGVINFGCYRKSEKPDASLACNGIVVRFN
jgi:hypothetical protein